MEKIRFLVLLVVMVLLCPFLAAAAGPQDTSTFDSIRVMRTAPEKVTVGDKAVITLDLVNTGTTGRTVELKEILSPGADFDQSSTVKTIITHKGEGQVCFGANCSSQPPRTFSEYSVTAYSYSWSISLGPGDKKQVSYWIIPRQVGDYLIRPSSLKVNDKEYFLPAQSIQVACRSGHACDTANGENTITCPENCAGSAADALCDPAKDGQCDPDCANGVDPDCTNVPATGAQTTKATPVEAGTILCAIGAASCAAIVLRKK
jgi:hypothetical protein